VCLPGEPYSALAKARIVSLGLSEPQLITCFEQKNNDSGTNPASHGFVPEPKIEEEPAFTPIWGKNPLLSIT
jgi:hypothetical protein